MARILQRASQPVHPLLEPAKELCPSQQLERGWSPHQVIYNCNLQTSSCNLLPFAIYGLLLQLQQNYNKATTKLLQNIIFCYLWP